MSDVPHWTIPEPSAGARQAALARQAELTKPAGSLGMLEELAVQIAAWQANERPLARPAAALIFAADHAVSAHGVSAYPAAVTPAMVENFVRGGAAASVLCRARGIVLSVVDVGVVWPADRSLPVHPSFFRDPVADMPAFDIRTHDALDVPAYANALSAGARAIERLSPSTRVVVLGEMGIGNTAVAAAVCGALLGGDPASFAGAGTGVVGEALERKRRVVSDAVRRLAGEADPHAVVRRVGGRDVAALVGAMARSAELGMVVIVDGFIVTAAALALCRASPQCRSALIFAHRSAEQAHGRVLEALDARPLLDLSMRLGEGTGALIAYGIVEAACELHCGMATFGEAGVPSRAG